MVSLGCEKYLRLIFQALKGIAVNDPIAIALKIRAEFARRFRARPTFRLARFFRIRRKKPRFRFKRLFLDRYRRSRHRISSPNPFKRAFYDPIYIYIRRGGLNSFFFGRKTAKFFYFQKFSEFRNARERRRASERRQKSKNGGGKYAGSPEKYCGRIYRKTQDKLTKKAERILAKKRRIKRGADILSAPRFSFSFQANFLPIRTPMTDAIMSPRVQPLESPRQWSPGIFVLKSVSILILLL